MLIIFFPRRFFVIQQDAHARCIKVIVLPATLGPEKRAKEAQGQQYAAANQEVDDAHNSFLLFAVKWVARVVNEIMVTVLRGISTAATSGDSRPVTA